MPLKPSERVLDLSLHDAHNQKEWASLVRKWDLLAADITDRAGLRKTVIQQYIDTLDGKRPSKGEIHELRRFMDFLRCWLEGWETAEDAIQEGGGWPDA